jgi:xanthosine utilization system XapX-like protein
MGPSVRPNFFLFYSFLINIMSPAPPIAAALILTALLLIEKTPRKFQFGKKSAKVNHCLSSSIEQLQVAL